jgi:anti-sigma factor RsiW
MSEKDGRPENCDNPIDAAVLADYWISALSEAEEETVEEHLFACDPCGARLREMIALAEEIRRLAREGSLRMVVSDEFLRRAEKAGLRVRQYAPPAGGSVQCTVTAEDDLLIGRLAADLAGAGRVDLSICDERGAEQSRMRDIPVNPSSGGVVLQESITSIKAAPTSTLILRLVGVSEAGGERLLGEYTFHHTRTLPGPGD